jgi:hypothetical protein
MILPAQMKFELGRVVITANALQTVNSDDVLTSLNRHITGDWGDLEAEDRQVNESALRSGGRLLSAYRDGTGNRFWIITESDRQTTTVLLPEDY